MDIPEHPDLPRMRRERGRRLRAAMRDRRLDALVLLGNSNVGYATGVTWPLTDAGRGNIETPVAVVLADDEVPHLFQPFRAEESVDPVLPDDHCHGPVYLEYDEGVERFAAALAELVPGGARLAVDEWTGALQREHRVLFRGEPPDDAGPVVGGAKLIKTPDELAVLQTGLRITEAAVADAQALLAPGVRQIDLSATFLQRVFELGADANVLDPIWQVMPDRIADGPWTTTGDLACPLLTTERVLAEGDVLWVDAGISFGGYSSDFGRTWLVGRDPTAAQQDHFATWREIVGAVLAVTRGGATAGDLTRAAVAVTGGPRPWMPHFYLGHGLGIDSAEMPFVGSDLGPEFDDHLVLEAGMVLVLEPIVWVDGAAGYRVEEVVVVTDEGWIPMTDYPYDPYG